MPQPIDHWKTLVRQNQHHIDFIMDRFADAQLDPMVGAELLAFLAGMSFGLQQRDARPLAEAIARGWQLGASNAD